MDLIELHTLLAMLYSAYFASSSVWQKLILVDSVLRSKQGALRDSYLAKKTLEIHTKIYTLGCNHFKREILRCRVLENKVLPT